MKFKAKNSRDTQGEIAADFTKSSGFTNLALLVTNISTILEMGLSFSASSKAFMAKA